MKLTISVCLLYVAVSSMNTGRAMGRTACLPCIFKNHLDALDLKRFKPVTKNLLNRLDQEMPTYSKHKLLHYHKQQRAHQQQVDAARMRDLEDAVDRESAAAAQVRRSKWPKQRHDKRYVSYLTLCHFKICNMGRKRATRSDQN